MALKAACCWWAVAGRGNPLLLCVPCVAGTFDRFSVDGVVYVSSACLGQLIHTLLAMPCRDAVLGARYEVRSVYV